MGERMRGTVVSKSIVYGTISFYQGKKAEEQSSHKWACYVRARDDLSVYLKKVVFTLHPSFKEAQRTVDRPPFEVCEIGWGEFDITIQLHFHDPREKKLELSHFLRLYPQSGESQSTKKPVISECCDEMVFTDPFPDFHERLLNGVGVEPDEERLQNPFHLEIMQYYRQYTDEEFVRVLKTIEEGQLFVRDSGNGLREQLRKLDAEIQALRSQLRDEERK